MKIDTFACDVCGAVKQQANHWWVIYPPTEQSSGIGLWPWNYRDSGNTPQLHLCGAACATKKISEFMGGKA